MDQKYHTIAEITTQINNISFFKNLKIPSLNEYLLRKLGDQQFSYIELKNKETNLEKKYSSIRKFISKKYERRLIKEIEIEKQKVINSFSRKEKLVSIIGLKYYQERGSYEDSFYPLTLDNYISYKKDLSMYEYSYVLGMLSHAENLHNFYVKRVLSLYRKEITENFINAIYNCSSNLSLLRFFLKDVGLNSFSDSLKKLYDLIRYDKNIFSYDSTPDIYLSKEQTLEFAKFYLTNPDKRLNAHKIIFIIIFHFKKYQIDGSLIDNFLLDNYRKFSSVIAGKFTLKSYSDKTLYFFKKNMSTTGYELLYQRIIDDEKNGFNNSIKISFN